MNGWLSFGSRTEHPGALQVDILRLPAVAVQADIRALPFAAETFAGVECLAVIEHLGPQDAPLAARELWRVLKRAGCLVVATHDILACARTLLNGNLAVLHNIYSPHASAPLRHQWGYTWGTFADLFVTAGFTAWQRLPLTEPHEIRAQASKQ